MVPQAQCFHVWQASPACHPTHAAVCGVSYLTTFKLDNLCTATSPANSPNGCWVPQHNSDAQLVPNTAASVANKLSVSRPVSAFYARDVLPTSQRDKLAVRVSLAPHYLLGPVRPLP